MTLSMKKVLKVLCSIEKEPVGNGMKKPMYWVFVFYPNVDGTFLVVKPDFDLGNISSPLDKNQRNRDTA